MKAKKVFALLSAVCILMAGFTGCGEKKTAVEKSEDVTVRIFTNKKNRPDCALVNQQLSEMSMEKIGIKAEIMFGYDADKITLMLASNEKMDIGFDSSSTFISRARQNAYADITDKLKTVTPDLYAALPKEYWEYTKIDGKNYAVPTYKEMAEQWTMLVDKEIIEEHDIDISKIKELKDMEIVFEALKQHPERAGYEILSSNTLHMDMALKGKYDTVYDYFVIDRENPDKILYYIETEDYREYVNLMRDWYNKGYIAKDITTRTDYESYHNSGDVGVIYTQYQPYCENAFKASYNADLVPIHLTPAVMTNSSMLGSMFGVYNKSENIDASLKFLELWNTDADIKNLITYGIEGKHYNLVDGKVKTIEGAYDLYKMQNATCGNMMISYLMDNEPDDKYEKFDAFNKSAVISPALGFLPVTDNIQSKLGACTNVISEYNPLLCCGAVDPDKYLDKMLDSLKKAGVDEVKKEIQKQYDQWRKEYKKAD